MVSVTCPLRFEMAVSTYFFPVEDADGVYVGVLGLGDSESGSIVFYALDLDRKVVFIGQKLPVPGLQHFRDAHLSHALRSVI